MAEWGNSTACQVVLVTDGNPGVGSMSLGNSLNSLNLKGDSNLFPLPFPYPGKLSIVCISSQQGIHFFLIKFPFSLLLIIFSLSGILEFFIISDNGLIMGLPLYQRLVELAGGDSVVLIPEGPLSRNSVINCFQKLAEVNYVSFQGYLKCGHLGSRILLSPPPLVLDS